MCCFQGGPLRKGGPEATASFASPNIHHCLGPSLCLQYTFFFFFLLVRTQQFCCVFRPLFSHSLRKNCTESILYNNAIKLFLCNCNVYNFSQNKFIVKFLSNNLVIMAINQISINNFE